MTEKEITAGLEAILHIGCLEYDDLRDIVIAVLKAAEKVRTEHEE